MTIASEITDLQTNLAAAKAAVTTKGGTVGNTGLAGLANEIATIPSSGGGGTDWGVLYFHPWAGEWDEYTDAVDSCTASILDLDSFMWAMINLGFVEQHLFEHPALWDSISATITAQDVGDNVWEVVFMGDNGETYEDTWDATNSPDWWENNWGLSVTVDSGATYFSFVAVAQYMYSYDTSTTLSLELDQSSYNDFTLNDGCYLGFIPFDSVIGFQFGRLATSTPDRFLETANNLVSLDWTYATSLTSIGNNFLRGCTSFDQQIVIPSSVTTIGGGFLMNCSAFNKSLVVPSTVTAVGADFLSGCESMVSTVYCEVPTSAVAGGDAFTTHNDTDPAYTTGITLAGTYASDWKTKFPDSDSYPYRKLILES